MEIRRLPIGEIAPADADCVRIQEQEDGTFLLEGSVLSMCEDKDEADSVSLVASEPYASYASAEAAGITWASGCGVRTLHLSRSNGVVPLPDPA